MKYKFKNGISFAETTDLTLAMQTILRILDYTINFYEGEGTDIALAQEEATNLIYSKYFGSLNNNTVAQWIANGGNERKALDAIKDFIVEASKDNVKEKEQKVILAKVFSKS